MAEHNYSNSLLTINFLQRVCCDYRTSTISPLCWLQGSFVDWVLCWLITTQFANDDDRYDTCDTIDYANFHVLRYIIITVT